MKDKEDLEYLIGNDGSIWAHNNSSLAWDPKVRCQGWAKEFVEVSQERFDEWKLSEGKKEVK